MVGPGQHQYGFIWGHLARRELPCLKSRQSQLHRFDWWINEATWLDRSDLVFIDPVGTGFSRAAKPELNSKFHAVRGDITSVGEFIRMYLSATIAGPPHCS